MNESINMSNIVKEIGRTDYSQLFERIDKSLAQIESGSYEDSEDFEKRALADIPE